MNKKNQRYTKEMLEEALDLVESGGTYSDACRGTSLNKSIIAREMRKRHNAKGKKNIEKANEKSFRTFLELYEALEHKE